MTHKEREDKRIKELMMLHTRTVWACFNKFENDQLDALLEAAGVIVPSGRAGKMEAACRVWFGVAMPDMEEFRRLNAIYRQIESGARP